MGRSAWTDRDRIGGTLDRATFAIFPLLLLFGGAGNDYPLIGAFVEAAALLLLVQAISPQHRGEPTRPLGRAGLIVAGAVALLPLLQIVPLPGALAFTLPGRGLATAVLAAAGLQVSWHPLSLTPGDTVEAALELLPGLAMFVTAMRLDRRHQVLCVGLVIGAAVISTLLGVMQRSAGILDIYTTSHAQLAPGLFVNRNHESTFLLIAMVLTPVFVFAMLPRERRTERVVLTSALCFLFAAGVLATASRTGILLLPPAAIVAALLAIRSVPRPALLIPALVAAALVSWAMSRLPVAQVVLARFVGGDNRWSYWADTVSAARDVWPIGSGIASFADVFPAYEGIIGSNRINAAHNDYVQLLLEGGAPVLLLFAAVAILLVGAAVRLRCRSDRTERKFGYATLAGLAIILGHSATDYPLRMAAIMASAGLLAGIALSIADRADEGRHAAETKRRRGWTPGLAWLLVTPLIVLIAGAGLAHAWPGPAMPRWLLLAAPLSANARVRAGDAAFAAGATHAAEADALQALSLAPLNAGAVELLVRVRDAQARWRDVDRLLAVADKLTRRDAPIRYMLLTRAAERGDFEAAMADADLLLRQHAYEEQLYPYLRTVSAYPEIRRALVRRLALQPSWRAQFIAGLRGLDLSGHRGFALLLQAMRASSKPPTATEVEPFLLRLIASGETDLARAVRDEVVRQGAGGRLLRDERFARIDARAQSGLFGWRIADRGALLPSDGGAGLMLETHGSGAIVEQITLLQPGRYTLRWTTRTRRPAALAAVQWAVFCLGRGTTVPLGRPEISSDLQRSVVTQTLVVPQECPVQGLRLFFGGDPIGTGPVMLERAELLQS